jgi:putative membrane protein
MRIKTSYPLLILLSAAVVHCGRESTSEPASPSPGPEPAMAAAPPPEGESMTPASGRAEGDPSRTAPMTSEPRATEPAAGAAETHALSDEQIIKVADLANSSEIEQGKLAQKKATHSKVKAFAATMVSHHGKAKDRGGKLATRLSLVPAESPVASQLKSDADSMMSSLQSTAAGDFDGVYIAGQIDAHQKVLSALDERLIPNARDPELRSMLEEMRTTVQSHLDQAKGIQNELTRTAPGTPSTSSGGMKQ